MSMKEWAKKEVELACKHENPDRKEGEFDYGCMSIKRLSIACVILMLKPECSSSHKLLKAFSALS